MQEKKFIQKGASKVRLHEYLEHELEGAGYSHSDVVRTPTSTKIMVYAERPGLVIGRGGSRIKELTSKLEEDFEYDNPQVEVNEIEDGDADAQIVAKSMASWLEKGGNAKRVGYTYLRRMKEAGVIGAEIEISGKLSGNRGRTEKFSYGYVKRCGNTSRDNVDHGYELANTKPGAIGVKVRIMKELPDFKHRNVDVEEEILHEVETEDKEPKSERIKKILIEANSMTAAEIEDAAEEVGVDMEDIEIVEVRDAEENFDEEELEEELDQTEPEEEETKSKEEDESTESEDQLEENEESESEEVDYDEIVSGTISDGKDQLEEMDDPDYEAALEAEKSNKNRTTFVDWLETRVNQ